MSGKNTDAVDTSGEADGLTEEEREDLETADPKATPISYSGQDFDVNGLVQRLQKGDILIPSFGHDDARIESASFQRSFVWRRPQMDRFIESILLGYPIPGIFLVKQKDKRYLVLDGQQRLKTLRHFKEGTFGKNVFSLKQVSGEFVGLTYRALNDEHRRMFDDTFIQATIVASDGSHKSLEAIYRIFERLNAGGTQLTPHEIRIALYAGSTVDFIESLNRIAAWRNIYGPRSPRLRDQELVLRIVALDSERGGYKAPLKKFLNDFLGRHRDGPNSLRAKVEERFAEASRLVADGTGAQGLRFGSSQVNAALTEAIWVALMDRLAKKKSVPDANQVATIIKGLKKNERLTGSVTVSTSHEEAVRTRLDIALKAFAKA